MEKIKINLRYRTLGFRRFFGCLNCALYAWRKTMEYALNHDNISWFRYLQKTDQEAFRARIIEISDKYFDEKAQQQAISECVDIVRYYAQKWKVKLEVE